MSSRPSIYATRTDEIIGTDDLMKRMTFCIRDQYTTLQVVSAVGGVIDGIRPRKSGSHQTPRWRKPDSNSWSLSRIWVVEFAPDSLLEEGGFEPPVPLANEMVTSS